MGHKIAVAGASGYAGGEVLRLLCAHPDLEIVAVSAHSHANQPVTSVHPQLRQMADQRFCETTPQAFEDADLVIMTLPHGHSAALAAELPDHTKIVDLGADHRLTKESDWHAYYSGPYAGAWTYGLPELPGRKEAIAASTRVAATGCYAVATTLALAPIVSAGVGSPDDVVVVAASGTSGAGRAAKPHLMASEIVGSLTPYKVGAHQHVPEIKQETGVTSLSFTPVLAPIPRGILATVTIRPAHGKVTTRDVRDVLDAAYRDAPFVDLLNDGWPQTGATAGSNSCHIQATMDTDANRIIVTSAVDNLGKGAAGQVVQCANLMLGLPETQGLTQNGVAP